MNLDLHFIFESILTRAASSDMKKRDYEDLARLVREGQQIYCCNCVCKIAPGSTGTGQICTKNQKP